MVQSWFQHLTPYFAYLILVATIGPLLFGFHLAELNAPQDVLTCIQDQPPPPTTSSLPQCIPMTTAEFSVASSSFTLGGLVGALAAGPAGGRYGRLNSMRCAALFAILGPLAEACATSVVTISIGRFISGIGAGAAIVVVPIYIFEISPPEHRGFFGSLTQVMVNIGIFVTELLGYFLSRGQLWRIVLGVGGVFGLGQLAGLAFAVESPKWHVDHGLATEAQSNLQAIRGRGVDIRNEVSEWRSDEPELADEEGERLINNDELRASTRNGASATQRPVSRKDIVGFAQALLDSRYNRATLGVMLVMVSQQFTGINSIIMYGVSLLSDLLDQSSALLNVLVATLNVALSIACTPLPDRIGRKPCLLLSIGGMGVSSFLLAIAIKSSLSVLAAVSVLAFVGSFCFGLGPVPFMLPSELVGAEAVGAVQSWALATNWISTFAIAQFFPLLNQALGKGNVFFVFSALAALFAAAVGVLVPETKQKKDAGRLQD